MVASVVDVRPSVQRILLFLGLLLPLLPAAAQGQVGTLIRSTSDARSQFPIERATAPVRIDGVLDDAIWVSATEIPLPFEVDPGNNVTASVQTVCRTSYDEENFYFACEARDDDPNGIRAYVTDRDQIESHDRIIVGLDPFNDSRRAFLFSISALGVQLDATWQQGTADNSWDAIWNSAGRITETGYVVEGAVPFKSLRFPAGSTAQTWGVWFERLRPRSVNARFMSMRWDRGNSCLICQGSLLTGLQGISPGRNLEITPTFTSNRTDVREDGLPGLQSGSVDANAGVDARIGLTPALTLNATVNPDFSQVEADVAQLNVNNQFTLFFPERRPFFLEGADLFSTPLQAVFTRTISNPIYGTKLSGKNGSNAYGALLAEDRETAMLFPGPEGSSTTTLNQHTTTMIGRYRRDIGSSSTVGVLYTGREGTGYHNRLVGADAFMRPFGPVTTGVQVARSTTSYPAEVAAENDQPVGGFDGTAVEARGSYITRGMEIGLTYNARSPGFRADAGFVTSVGRRSINLWGGPTIWGKPGSFLTSATAHIGGWRNTQSNGDLLAEGVWTWVNFNGPAQSNLWINPNIQRQKFQGVEYDLVRIWFGGSVRPTGTVGLEFNGNVGPQIDFTNNQRAHQLVLTPAVDVRVGRHLEGRVSHTFQRLSRNGERIFNAHLSQVRGVYSANTRMFARVILQYSQVDRNPSLFRNPVAPSSKTLLTSLLLSYKVNPLTVAFLGYGDNREGGTTVDGIHNGLAQTDRTLFLKLGYAWRP